MTRSQFIASLDQMCAGIRALYLAAEGLDYGTVATRSELNVAATELRATEARLVRVMENSR